MFFYQTSWILGLAGSLYVLILVESCLTAVVSCSSCPLIPACRTSDPWVDSYVRGRHTGRPRGLLLGKLIKSQSRMLKNTNKPQMECPPPALTGMALFQDLFVSWRFSFSHGFQIRLFCSLDFSSREQRQANVPGPHSTNASSHSNTLWSAPNLFHAAIKAAEESIHG